MLKMFQKLRTQGTGDNDINGHKQGTKEIRDLEMALHSWIQHL